VLRDQLRRQLVVQLGHVHRGPPYSAAIPG
jgi:hypothetical protein